ncbi:spore protease YyaC [Terrihalobacillus insolitus]|uniref:spore protease YyaC n=1 Tax=Terrihalobacillus insolitus TaxID=2950438 RepID=UPI002342572C|nr:spore protease YyaC [Terrihalobacillus insolitus]MDC3414921.1 spore protease YyaC [Terrihalobacillus insolitus]
MNLMKKKSPKNEHRFTFDDPLLTIKMGENLLDWIPNGSQDIIILCIGTDRSTGDSLGPITGMFLKEREMKELTVFGTISNPVHAVNLEDELLHIKQQFSNPYIIAVDACLGKTKSIGSIIAGRGPLKPGAALNKALPDVGDVHISGVVNVAGFMEYYILQNTRLDTVMRMAGSIANVLSYMDKQLHLIRKKVTNLSQKPI